MIRTVKTAVLWAGLATLGCGAAAASQPPQTQPSNSPGAFWFASDGGSSYLGVDVQDVTADRVTALKLKEERGVEVTMVDQDAPAGKAGLKEHDVILDFNGTVVEGAEQLRRLIREVPAGRTVALGISRDGSPMKISVQLADRGKLAIDNVGPKVYALPRLPDVSRFDAPGYAFQVQTYSSTLGIQTENLSRQLGEFFGVKDGEGILVRSVEKGSAAEKAGIKAGDVIVRADNEKLSDRADLTHILRNHRAGGKVSLGIVRDKREQTITVDLPHRSSDDSFFVWPNADQFKGNWEEMQKEFRQLIDEARPETERLQLNARLALEKARQQAREIRPQLDQALRRSQQELRRAQKLMEEQRKELRKRIDMI
ncbi:MAG TPA: PDZ domain-containing protein [Candidatus Angelobacter sp.]